MKTEDLEYNSFEECPNGMDMFIILDKSDKNFDKEYKDNLEIIESCGYKESNSNGYEATKKYTKEITTTNKDHKICIGHNIYLYENNEEIKITIFKANGTYAISKEVGKKIFDYNFKNMKEEREVE
jgi:hypothetical protein